jgi:hypothetical protein
MIAMSEKLFLWKARKMVRWRKSVEMGEKGRESGEEEERAKEDRSDGKQNGGESAKVASSEGRCDVTVQLCQ